MVGVAHRHFVGPVLASCILSIANANPLYEFVSPNWGSPNRIEVWKFDLDRGENFQYVKVRLLHFNAPADSFPYAKFLFDDRLYFTNGKKSGECGSEEVDCQKIPVGSSQVVSEVEFNLASDLLGMFWQLPTLSKDRLRRDYRRTLLRIRNSRSRDPDLNALRMELQNKIQTKFEIKDYDRFLGWGPWFSDWLPNGQ